MSSLKYRQENRDKIRIARRDYYLRNRDNPRFIAKQRETRERWRKTEHGKLFLREYMRNQKRKKQVFIRDTWGWSCSKCSSDEGRMQTHKLDGSYHKQLAGMGWCTLYDLVDNHFDEYTTLCVKCHNLVHDKLSKEWLVARGLSY